MRASRARRQHLRHDPDRFTRQHAWRGEREPAHVVHVHWHEPAEEPHSQSTLILHTTPSVMVHTKCSNSDSASLPSRKEYGKAAYKNKHVVVVHSSQSAGRAAQTICRHQDGHHHAVRTGQWGPPPLAAERAQHGTQGPPATHTRTHTHTRTRTPTHAHTCTHVRTHMRIRAHAPTHPPQ